MSVKKNYTAEEKAKIALEALRGHMCVIIWKVTT